jgi:hypothetical protein
MHGTYLQNKKSVYNWMAKNKKKNTIIQARATKKYQTWKKIQRIYLNILLNI